MIKHMLTSIVLALSLIAGSASASECSANLNYTVETLTGNNEVNLFEAYQGKVILVVNTASKYSFTGQYEGLEKLYSDYKEQGLVVLGFSSNNFDNQKPGSSENIANI